MHQLPDLIDGIEQEILQGMAKYDIPGVSIAICDAQQILWTSAFGTLQRGSEQPVTDETMFSIQSCSKMHTTIAVLLAVQHGLLDLEEPITRYLPEFSVRSWFEHEPEARITLRHLLTHTAGFTHEAPTGSNFEVGSASFDRHCRSIAETWLRFPVGHHYEYSNLGFDLAAYIVQVASGEPFHRFVERALFQPLGMNRTTFDHDAIVRDPNRARGHSKELGKRLPTRIPMTGAGGVYTSVRDACRFMQFNLAHGESLIDHKLLSLMAHHPEGRVTGYGAGLVSMRANGSLVHGHGGGGFGFLSDMYWMPREGFAIAVLTNSVDHPLQGKLAMKALKRLSTERLDAPPLPPRALLDASVFQSLYGDYVGRGGTLAVFGKGVSGPIFSIDGSGKGIRLVDSTTFMVEDDDRETYRFLIDSTDSTLCYLQNLDTGFVRYRNDIPAISGDMHPQSAPWNRSYDVRVNGIPLTDMELVQDVDFYAIHQRGTPPLRLRPIAPGLYISSTGEVLDVTKEIPTYANIKLHPTADSRSVARRSNDKPID